LTPAGAMEKTRLTYEYISISYHYFKTARKRLQTLFDTLEKQGLNRFIFYGTGEVADIALLSMTGTNMRLIDVVDPDREGQRFANFTIKPHSRLKKTDFDILLVTAIDDHETIVDTLERKGVPIEKIKFF
jgi:hypothetical protein